MSYTFDSWRQSDDNDWISETQPKVYFTNKEKRYVTAGCTAVGAVICGGVGALLGGLECIAAGSLVGGGVGTFGGWLFTEI